jgi:aminopeptidase YwaD
MIRSSFILLFLFSACFSFSQNEQYYKNTINILCSKDKHGRGYVNNGEKKASKFIEKEFEKIGLKKFSTSFIQTFYLDVNTFPGKTILELNNQKLIPGQDFIIAPGSIGCKGTFELCLLNKTILDDTLEFEKFKKIDFSNKFVVIDNKGMTSPEEKKAMRSLASNPFKSKGIIFLSDDKFTWSVSKNLVEYIVLEIKRNVFNDSTKTVKLEIENEFIKNYKTQNIIGFIPGTITPDSFIVFSSHYDHLGQMGQKALFAGANDNASGTAMLLDLANHYSKNKPTYSIVFMAFGAEEAGLVGSEYYTNNPLFPLEKIKFLTNLDLMSYGEDGITVVNGSVFEEEFEILSDINRKENLLVAVNKRGKAANSDHYHFSEKGVKSFFIYTLGSGKAYHDIYDTPEKLKHPKYKELFTLLLKFVEKL